MVSRYRFTGNLAIVGMDAAWAGCDGLDAFECMMYEARGSYAWPSSSAGEPRTVLSPASCESLLAKASQGALRDAGMDAARPGARIAVLYASETPASPRWDWAARVEDLSAHLNPLAAALERADFLLSEGMVEGVLFAAAAALPEIPTGAPVAGREPSLGFDRSVHGWRFGEGAGAVVWMGDEIARSSGKRVYAVISALAAAPGDEIAPVSALPKAPALDDLRGCAVAALESLGAAPGEVGYVEAFASGVDALDGIEIAALVQAYRAGGGTTVGQDLTTALGSAQSNAGYLGAAAGLAGLVRAALCLYHREIPGAAGWAAPKLPALWRNSSFYVPGESRTWFEKASLRGRLAGLNVIGLNGSCAHLILSEPESRPAQASRALSRGGFYLFPLSAQDLAGLEQGLDDLERSLTLATGLGELAAEQYAQSMEEDGAYGLAIAGHGQEEILREIGLARKAVPTCFEKGSDWQTPQGSYFTPQPCGRLGGVALVYPGAFNSYPGVGKDLFRLFPSLHERMARVTNDLGRVMQERLLYPRSLVALSREELAGLEARLLANPTAMLISGSALTILYTFILEEIFQVRPVAAFGYSLGENSMMYATGVWGQGDSAAARLEASDAFRVRLAGPQLAIREYWGLPPENGGGRQPLWSNYLVMAPPEKVQAALAGEPRVYLTHVNTPRQVVIGGDPQGVQRVLAELRCSSLQAPFDYALHCEVMRSEYGALAELHHWPVEKIPNLRLYSAAGYAPVGFDQEELAQKMAHMLTTPLDFPRLVRQIYADGSRVFIEAGAGSNCARWIDETLRGSPHLALSMDRRGTDDYSTLVRTLARLFCHRVPMDLAPLYRTDFEKVDG